MATLLQQTEQWTGLLHNHPKDYGRMLALLTQMVHQTLALCSSQRYLIVHFTVLDNLDHRLINLKKLDAILERCTDAGLDVGRPEDIAVIEPNKSQTNIHYEMVTDIQTVCTPLTEAPVGNTTATEQFQAANTGLHLQKYKKAGPLAAEKQCYVANVSVSVKKKNVCAKETVNCKAPGNLSQQRSLKKRKFKMQEKLSSPKRKKTRATNFNINETSAEATLAEKLQSHSEQNQATQSNNDDSNTDIEDVDEAQCEDKSCRCLICDKDCAMNWPELTKHVRQNHIESDSKNCHILKCPSCESTFVLDSLKLHMVTEVLQTLIIHCIQSHQQETPPFAMIHNCSQCNFISFKQDEVQSHETDQHTKVQSISLSSKIPQSDYKPKRLSHCIFCPAEDTNVKDMPYAVYYEHMMSKHVVSEGKRWTVPCPNCDERICVTCKPSRDKPNILQLLRTGMRHMNSKHNIPILEGMPVFKCDHCDFMNLDRDAVTQHMKSKHKATSHSASLMSLDQENTGSHQQGTHHKTVPKFVSHCVFCPLAAPIVKDMPYAEYIEHMQESHVVTEGRRSDIACPQCDEVFTVTRKPSRHRPNFLQLLKLGMEHLNRTHNIPILKGLVEFKCEECEFTNLDKDIVSHHAHKQHKVAGNSVPRKHMKKKSELEDTIIQDSTVNCQSEAEDECQEETGKPLQCFMCLDKTTVLKSWQDCTAHFHGHLTSDGNNSILRCHICSAEFPSPREKISQNLAYLIKCYAQHLSKAHEHPISQFFHRMKCPHCSFYTLSQRDLSHHNSTRHKGKTRCEECGKSLSQKSQHCCPGNMDMTKVPCDRCGLISSSRSALERHINVVHLNIRDYLCHACDKRFSKRHNLELHLLRVHDVRPADKETEKCPVCGIVTFAGYEIAAHMEKHKVASYPCQHCDAVFPTKRKMYHHVSAKHKRQKLLSCPECPYQTSNRHTLTKHVNGIHKKQRIACHVCQFRAADEIKLQQHIAVKHAGGEITSITYPCQHCGKVFRTKYRLECHTFCIHKINMTNKEVLQCDLCEYQVICRTMLQEHMRNKHTHTMNFICPTCHRIFNSQAKLRNHCSRSHPVKNRYQCEQCSYVTDSKSQFVLHHSRKHSGKRLKCNICRYATYLEHLYAKHMTEKHPDQEDSLSTAGGQSSQLNPVATSSSSLQSDMTSVSEFATPLPQTSMAMSTINKADYSYAWLTEKQEAGKGDHSYAGPTAKPEVTNNVRAVTKQSDLRQVQPNVMMNLQRNFHATNDTCTVTGHLGHQNVGLDFSETSLPGNLSQTACTSQPGHESGSLVHLITSSSHSSLYWDNIPHP